MTAERKAWYRRSYFGMNVGMTIVLAVFLVLILPGASVYYRYSAGRSCARCHEIWQPYTDWHTSTHRNVPCSDCHGDVFTLDLGFHLKNIHRLVSHLRGEIPEQVRLKNDDVLRMENGVRSAISKSMRTGQPDPTPLPTKKSSSTTATITAST